MNLHITRRSFNATLGGALASLALDPACRRASEPRQSEDGSLTARPKADGQPTAKGEAALGLDQKRDAILHLPTTPTKSPMPLLVLFHGAGGKGERVLQR